MTLEANKKVRLIWEDDFELPFTLPIFRCIGDDGDDTGVYLDTYKGKPIYVGIADGISRLKVRGRNADHESFIKKLPKGDFIERRVVATLSREDAEYLESSLIHFYGRKDMGGSLLNWSNGVEKSPLERLEENGANPWELFELHFWGYTRILARKEFAWSKRELLKDYRKEPTRELFFQWWVQDATRKWGTPQLDPLKELITNERGFGRPAYGLKKQYTPTAEKIIREFSEAFVKSGGTVGDSEQRDKLVAAISEEQCRRSEEILTELATEFVA